MKIGEKCQEFLHFQVISNRLSVFRSSKLTHVHPFLYANWWKMSKWIIFIVVETVVPGGIRVQVPGRGQQQLLVFPQRLGRGGQHLLSVQRRRGLCRVLRPAPGPLPADQQSLRLGQDQLCGRRPFIGPTRDVHRSPALLQSFLWVLTDDYQPWKCSDIWFF